jgi:hypothetical protein
MVSGLAGAGLVLRDNGGDDLAAAADGAIVFPTKIASGASYSVTVFTQPTSPAQTCAVTDGSGTMGSSDVTNVAVSCTLVSLVSSVARTFTLPSQAVAPVPDLSSTTAQGATVVVMS